MRVVLVVIPMVVPMIVPMVVPVVIPMVAPTILPMVVFIDPPPCLWARSGRVLRSVASSPEPQSSVLKIL